jgi:hypothetical protein
LKKETELLWASEKYTVMAKGYNFYKDIQGKMREAQSAADYMEIEKRIVRLKQKPFDKKALLIHLNMSGVILRKRQMTRINSIFFRCWMS